MKELWSRWPRLKNPAEKAPRKAAAKARVAAEAEDILRLRASGLSCQACANPAGVRKSSVWDVLRRAGERNVDKRWRTGQGAGHGRRPRSPARAAGAGDGSRGERR